MILGTGIDIIEIERVKESIDSTDSKFCERVYTKKEIVNILLSILHTFLLFDFKINSCRIR